jgi:hypothetical protein
VALSRSGQIAPSSQSEWCLLKQILSAVRTQRVNVSDGIDVQSLMHGSDLRLHGVWHAAGVLSDAILTQQDEQRLYRVYAPKVAGAYELHVSSLGGKLASFVFFSSVASLLGSAGQANYSAANATLDEHATTRRAAGLAGVSIQWGPWGNIGMAANDQVILARVSALGFGLIEAFDGLMVLRHALQHQCNGHRFASCAVEAGSPWRGGRHVLVFIRAEHESFASLEVLCFATTYLIVSEKPNMEDLITFPAHLWDSTHKGISGR